MKLQADPADCLGPTFFIDSEHRSIRECAERVFAGESSVAGRAVALFEFVRDNVQYEFRGKFERDPYVASNTLAAGRGFCVQKALLLCALGRAAGVPSALILCDVRDDSLTPRTVEAMGTNMLYYHGLTAFHLGGRWVRVDASLSPDVMERKRYRPVRFDGTADALLASTTLGGEPHAEYIAFHGLYSDLQFEELMQAYAAKYGVSPDGPATEMGLEL